MTNINPAHRGRAQRLAAPGVTSFRIIDRVTGDQVGKPFKCGRAAARRAGRLDLEYGAHRYTVERITNPPASNTAFLRSILGSTLMTRS